MRRHLLGFALFNLIVGTALVVAILTGSFPRPATRYVYEVSKTSCPMNVRQNPETPKIYESKSDSIKVTQAVFNENTGKLNMSFKIQRETPATQDINVKLTFIHLRTNGISNGDGDDRMEFISVSPDFNVDNNAVYSIPLSYKWLSVLSRGDTFYVKAEIYNGNSTEPENVHIYDGKDFTPILVIDKK